NQDDLPSTAIATSDNGNTCMRTPTSISFGRLFEAVIIIAFAICLAAPALAKRAVPENLGNGLDALVESNLAKKAGAAANVDGFATPQAASYAKMALVDNVTGRSPGDTWSTSCRM